MKKNESGRQRSAFLIILRWRISVPVRLCLKLVQIIRTLSSPIQRIITIFLIFLKKPFSLIWSTEYHQYPDISPSNLNFHRKWVYSLIRPEKIDFFSRIQNKQCGEFLKISPLLTCEEGFWSIFTFNLFGKKKSKKKIFGSVFLCLPPLWYIWYLHEKSIYLQKISSQNHNKKTDPKINFLFYFFSSIVSERVIVFGNTFWRAYASVTAWKGKIDHKQCSHVSFSSRITKWVRSLGW